MGDDFGLGDQDFDDNWLQNVPLIEFDKRFFQGLVFENVIMMIQGKMLNSNYSLLFLKVIILLSRLPSTETY